MGFQESSPPAPYAWVRTSSEEKLCSELQLLINQRKAIRIDEIVAIPLGFMSGFRRSEQDPSFAPTPDILSGDYASASYRIDEIGMIVSATERYRYHTSEGVATTPIEPLRLSIGMAEPPVSNLIAPRVLLEFFVPSRHFGSDPEGYPYTAEENQEPHVYIRKSAAMTVPGLTASAHSYLDQATLDAVTYDPAIPYKDFLGELVDKTAGILTVLGVDDLPPNVHGNQNARLNLTPETMDTLTTWVDHIRG